MVFREKNQKIKDSFFLDNTTFKGQKLQNPSWIQSDQRPFLFRKHCFLEINFFLLTNVPVCSFGNMVCLQISKIYCL